VTDDAYVDEEGELDEPELDDGEFDDEIGGEGNRIIGARARAVVEHVARNLAEEPDEIDIEVHERRDSVTLLVHASQSDVGRLIGRRGRVIQAVRQVARAAGASEGVRVTVDVAE
jgi:uncharacterized protein